MGKTKIVVLSSNTTTGDYAGFTDKIVAIQKEGQTIILKPEDLRQLEKKIGGQFRR